MPNPHKLVKAYGVLALSKNNKTRGFELFGEDFELTQNYARDQHTRHKTHTLLAHITTLVKQGWEFTEFAHDKENPLSSLTSQEKDTVLTWENGEDTVLIGIKDDREFFAAL